MRRVTDNQTTRFVIRTYGRKPGASDNVRQYNCETLQQMTLTLARQMNEPMVSKVECLAVLEVFVKE